MLRSPVAVVGDPMKRFQGRGTAYVNKYSSNQTAGETVQTETISRRTSEVITAWLFSTPALILLTVFLFISFVMAFGLAFTD